jgi:bacteriocin biosynthesis cyclodehydratase domain-containing protein
MYAKGLQIIPVSADRFVLKRGIHELLLAGPGVRGVVEPLVGMLDGSSTRDEIVAMFPADRRADVAHLIDTMVRRGLIDASPAPVETDDDDGALERAFFQNFPAAGAAARDTLQSTCVLVVGVNLVSRALVRALLECGVGRVVLADDPVLDNFLSPLVRAAEDAWGNGTDERLVRRHGLPELADAALVCATSDFGEADVLLDVNRMAIEQGTCYLPAWVADLIGYVGPLVHPHDTACLRCYRLRADSNDEHYRVRRAVRDFVTVEESARPGAGLLSPMASMVGEIAAMEAINALVEFAPSNVIGRQIQMNLVSFGASVRRVLKVPRCPDCSDQTLRSPRALTVGPQIASRNAG